MFFLTSKYGYIFNPCHVQIDRFNRIIRSIRLPHGKVENNTAWSLNNTEYGYAIRQFLIAPIDACTSFHPYGWDIIKNHRKYRLCIYDTIVIT